MPPFDPKNPPRWVKRMLQRAARTRGEQPWAEARRDGTNRRQKAMSLGIGTFVAPLPEGWSLRSHRPFEGRIVSRDGFEFHYRIESYEDPPAARGDARILDYVDEPELRGETRSPREVLENILVSVPDTNARGRDIIWKRLDPLGGTYVRELILRCTLATDDMVAKRMSIGRAVGEWLNLGAFAPEATPLDRVAHTARLERGAFQERLLMRTPRGWAVEIGHAEGDRIGYAVEHPGDRETLWISSVVQRVPDGADPKAFFAEVAASGWDDDVSANGCRLTLKRREALADGDLLRITANDEEEMGEPLRRITWLRHGLRDRWLMTAMVNLVTAVRYLDEPEQIETEALVDREVRAAILVPPPG